MNEKTRRAMSIVGTSKGRPEDDFYVTPHRAVEDLLRVEQFGHRIWEPACGNGAISSILELHGHEVISTDLYNHGYGKHGRDFLQYTSALADNIITNPPYNLAMEFAKKSLYLCDKVALLLKLNFLEGQRRKKFFEKYPSIRIHVFSKRLTMFRNGQKDKYSSGMIAFAWFVWERGFTGKPRLDWL